MTCGRWAREVVVLYMKLHGSVRLPSLNHFQVANPWWAAKLRSGHQPSATGAVVIGVGSEWYPGDHHSIADTCYS